VDSGLGEDRTYKAKNVWTGERQDAGEGGIEVQLDEGESVLLWLAPENKI
jgi:hypothetical protein